MTWNWNAHTVVNSNSVKNKSLYLFYIPRYSFPLETPFKRCVDCTLNKIECDFAKIECLVSPLSLSTRQCKINSLHGNLLWAVLLRQFAVCWGKGSSRYIYHPLPPATIQPTSNHWAEVLIGGSGIRISHHNRSSGKQKTNVSGPFQVFTKEEVKSTTWGDRDQRWAFAVMKNTVAFLESFIYFLLVTLAWIVSFLLLSKSSTHIVRGTLHNCTKQHGQN